MGGAKMFDKYVSNIMEMPEEPLENLTEIGTPIPKFLVNIVHRLKNTVENKVNSDTDKKE